MADFTIRELQGLAKKNPSAEWVSGFVGSLEKGEFDEAARKQGVDISKISPTYKQSITEDVSQVQDRIGERQEQRTQDINMLKSQQDSLQGNEALENARQIGLKKSGKTAESIGNLLNLTSFGEGIGVAADEIRGKLSKNYDSVSEINEKRLDQLLQTQDSILGKLKEATESGDTETVEKMKALLQQSGDDLHKLDIDVSERINELPSNKEVIGSALSLATLAAGGTIARGAGTLATKAIPALATPATSVIGGITQGAIKGAAVATPVGLVEGVGRGITAEKDAKGVIGQSLTSGALAGLGGGVFGGIAGGVAARKALAPTKAQNKILDLVTPETKDLTPTEYKRELSRGNIKPKTKLGAEKYVLPPNQQETALKYQKLISKDKVKTVGNILDEVSKLDDEVGTFLQKNNSPVAKSDLKTVLMNRIDDVDDVTISPESLASRKEKMVDAIVDGLNSDDYKGVWEARKNLDRNSKMFSGAPSLKKELQTELRNAMQELISEGTDDVTYKAYMKDMSGLLNINDNLAKGATKERGINAIQEWMKRNPNKAGTMKFLVGTGVAGTVASQVIN